MDESRKQFLEWLQPFWSRDTFIDDDGDQQFVDEWVQGAWVGWQASRAAIEIKLDDKVMVEDEFDKGHNCAIDYCAEAIRAAGIKVKE